MERPTTYPTSRASFRSPSQVLSGELIWPQVSSSGPETSTSTHQRRCSRAPSLLSTDSEMWSRLSPRAPRSAATRVRVTSLSIVPARGARGGRSVKGARGSRPRCPGRKGCQGVPGVTPESPGAAGCQGCPGGPARALPGCQGRPGVTPESPDGVRGAGGSRPSPEGVRGAPGSRPSPPRVSGAPRGHAWVVQVRLRPPDTEPGRSSRLGRRGGRPMLHKSEVSPVMPRNRCALISEITSTGLSRNK